MTILVKTFVFIFGAINVFIDFGRLYSIFISRTLPKSEFLTLFYFRLLIDGIAGIGAFLVTILDIINSNLWISISEVVIFFVSHPMVHVTTIRSLLVVVITLDRIFAIYFPISVCHIFSDRAHRSSIPNWVLILLVCISPIFDDVVLLKICNFELRFPPGCSNYTCLVKQCFSQYYLLTKEMVEHGIIVIGSLAIAVKLFLFKKDAKNKDLERANHLALIDAAVIFVFYFVPSLLTLAIPFFATIIELIMPLTKASGVFLKTSLPMHILVNPLIAFFGVINIFMDFGMLYSMFM